MQIERVQCLVRLKLNDRNDMMQIVKAGPDALSAPEIPVVRALHDIGGGMVSDECCISVAEVVDTVETNKAEEMERLKLKYGAAIIEQMYPQGRHMPLTLADCDLPPGCAVAKPKKAKAKAKEVPEVAEQSDDFDRDFWIEELKLAGVEIPEGELSDIDLWALVEDAGLVKSDAA